MTFLDRLGWGGADRVPLAGDASARRYSRLRKGPRSAILMEDRQGDLRLFERLSGHLRGLGLSAPVIHGRDDAQGLMLIEDLGDGLVARLATEPGREAALYRLATQVLVTLHQHAPPADLPRADPATLAAMTDLAFTWYARQDADRFAAVRDTLGALLDRHAGSTDVMILRDYHAENILFLPERTGVAQAGLLDFQDAMIGHRAYDLVSLLRDARRDVGAATVSMAVRHYLECTGALAAEFTAAMAVLGVQRNLRILGVFARLAQAMDKPHYVDLMPRVWGHLQTDLAHPALAPLVPLLTLPAPDAPLLQRLRTPCPTP